MSAVGRAVGIAVLILVVGGALLKGASPAGRSDPTASIDNGAPRGLLAAALLLARTGHDVVARKTLGPIGADIIDAGAVLVMVPPPEQTGLSPEEITDLLDLAARGGRLLVVCDGESKRVRRLRGLLDALSVDCVEVEADANAAAGSTTATATVPGIPAGVFVRDHARLALREVPGLLPLAAVGEAPVVAVVAHGRGDAVIVASASSLANDGLAEGDGAAFLSWVVGDRRVIVDERHHAGRASAVTARALLEGPGPLTAAFAVVLLVLGSFFSLAPRRGDAPSADEERPAPSAATRVRGLAALLARAPSRPPSDPSEPR